jgi:hypothetical protein
VDSEKSKEWRRGGNLEKAVLIYENVLWLKISMYNPDVVEVT